MATGNIPLEAFGPPPEYEGRLKRNVAGPVHNHYYTQPAEVPWYRRKRFCYPAVGLLVFTVITCAVVLGVVLKLESARKSDTTTSDDISSTTALGSQTEANSLGASSTTRRTSTELTVSVTPVSSTYTPPSTTTEVQETATPFIMSDKSQLASLLVRKGDSGQERRLLVLQEDTGHLAVTEWANRTVTRFRISEKLDSSAPEPKPGTPLAMEADQTGSVHLFYLSQTNLISHVSEAAAGRWKAGEVTDERGGIRTSSSSGLSAAWHRGRRTPDLLVLAYDDASQELRLAMADNPVGRNAWYVANVTSVLAESVPGQSNMPCYSLAGDWRDKRFKSDDDGQGRPTLLIGVVDKNEVVAWDCAIDFWPPPDVQVQCDKAEGAFADAKGDGLGLSPVPKQLLWVQPHEQDGYDFTLLSTDGSNLVRENLVGASAVRNTSLGFVAKSPIAAMSATSEGLVFLSLGKELQLYQKSGRGWENYGLAGLRDGLQA
ncbi:hypothetical protein VB005_06124 [Metarhizium brunneum]